MNFAFSILLITFLSIYLCCVLGSFVHLFEIKLDTRRPTCTCDYYHIQQVP